MSMYIYIYSTVVDVQFTIGFLDDDSNCVGDSSTYPPVFLQYRQHKNDEWIAKWNTSYITCMSMVHMIMSFLILILHAYILIQL